MATAEPMGDQSLEDRYQQLKNKRPEFGDHEYTKKIAVALDEVGVDHDVILDNLSKGVSDFWIPAYGDSLPRQIRPTQEVKYKKIQEKLLTNDFVIGPRGEWPGNHFNLSQTAIDEHDAIPYSLEFQRTLGPSTRALRVVDQVKYSKSGKLFALKRVRRKQSSVAIHHTKYTKGSRVV